MVQLKNVDKPPIHQTVLIGGTVIQRNLWTADLSVDICTIHIEAPAAMHDQRGGRVSNSCTWRRSNLTTAICNCDGDVGTDSDIEAFFRVPAGPCWR